MHQLNPEIRPPHMASMRITLYFLKLMLIVLVSCVAGGCTHRAMNSVIASWQGKQASEVIAVWGKPSEELKIEGKQLFIWNTYDGILSPPDVKSPSLLPDAKYCTRLLEVDRTGKVIHGAWGGNDCPWWFPGWAR